MSTLFKTTIIHSLFVIYSLFPSPSNAKKTRIENGII